VADKGHVVYGLHAVAAVLSHRVRDITSAQVLRGELRGTLATLLAQLESAGVPVTRLSRDELDRRAQGGVHQGIVIVVPPPREGDIGDLENLVAARSARLRLLVLDRVEDPRNLGACLRTADAAGVDAVIVPKARSAKLSSGALKAATGAVESVPLIVVPNLARALRWLRDAGVRLVGADERGSVPLYGAELRPPIAVVMGAEGRGLRRLTLEACDQVVRIPMHGVVDSLNVSVATGVLLFELLRQAPVDGG